MSLHLCFTYSRLHNVVYRLIPETAVDGRRTAVDGRRTAVRKNNRKKIPPKNFPPKNSPPKNSPPKNFPPNKFAEKNFAEKNSPKNFDLEILVIHNQDPLNFFWKKSDNKKMGNILYREKKVHWLRKILYTAKKILYWYNDMMIWQYDDLPFGGNPDPTFS